MKTTARHALSLFACSLFAAGAFAQTPTGPSLMVGILPFNDLSQNSDIGPLANTLPGLLRTTLVTNTNLIPKLITIPAPSPDPATVAQMAAGSDLAFYCQILSADIQNNQGNFNGPTFGSLSVKASSKSQKVALIIQVEIVDVNRGVKVATVRATGRASDSHIDPNVASTSYGSMDMSSPTFKSSSLGKATQLALDDLSKQISAALATFTPSGAPAAAPTAAAPPPTAATAQATPPPAAATAAAPAPATPVAAPAAGSSCSVTFRVVMASDMKPLLKYKLTVNQMDMSPMLKLGQLKLDHAPASIDLTVTFDKSPVNPAVPLTLTSTQPINCDKPNKILMLSIDPSGAGSFLWLQ